MDLRKLLTESYSRANTEEIVLMIVRYPKKMEELMECFFSGSTRQRQMSAWPIGIIGEKHPDLILPYLDRLVDNLNHPVHDAVVRNTVRIFQYLEIPDHLSGKVFDHCFHYLTNPKTAPAIRVFATTVLTNMAQSYPDLKEELVVALEDQIPLGSKGFQNRAQKELKRLR